MCSLLCVLQEVNFSVLESNGGGILEAFETLLSSIFIPALKQQSNWGSLSADAKGQQLKAEFLSKLSTFVSVLSNARASINDVVELSAVEGIDVRNYTTPLQMMAAAGNSEIMEIVEKKAQKWCEEIEQVKHLKHLQLTWLLSFYSCMYIRTYVHVFVWGCTGPILCACMIEFVLDHLNLGRY